VTRDDRDSPGSGLEELLACQRAAMARLTAASLAHAMGTGLQVVSGRAALIEAGGGAGADDARIVIRKAQDMTKVMHEALRYLRDDRADAVSCDPKSALLRAAALSSSLAAHRGVAVAAEAAAPRPVMMRPLELDLALVTLLGIAIAAAEPPATLTASVETSRGSPPKGEPAAAGRELVCVAWHVAPCGLAPEALPRLREPWLAPPSADRDTALGLALAAGLAREAGGWLALERADDAVVLGLHLPAAP
jgi:signal transduction histidine kinase